MTDKEITHEIRERGWTVREEQVASCGEVTGRTEYQAFFRGFQTSWRSSLEAVLADVREIQGEPVTKAEI